MAKLLYTYVSDASITLTIMLEKKQNAEVVPLVSLSMGSSGESIQADISFCCWPPQGGCAVAS